VSVIANQYMTNNFEQAEGQISPGLQQALYFKRTIGSVTTIPEIMADPTLLAVAETAVNLPQQFGLLNYDQQVQILTQKINLKQFSTSAGIDQFVQRYLALNQENASSQTSSQSGAITLANLIGAPIGSTLSILS
jgi:hypothetical protein